MSENKKKLYPFRFKKISEGSDIDKKVNSSVEQYKETYNIADLGYIDSEVDNGWLSGSTISDIMETYIDRIVGDNIYSFYGRQFPLQVKWIEVNGSMPLMVCPNDEIASQRYDALGKKKLWYVVDAASDAKIYLGFEKGVSAEELYNKCIKGNIKEDLHAINLKPGQSFLILPGTVHSLSGKMQILEISESSNLDLNICSWKPAGESGELNIEAAIDFVETGRCDYAYKQSSLNNNDEEYKEQLACEKEFQVTLFHLSDAIHINTENTGSFFIYTCTSGEAELRYSESKEVNKECGSSILLKSGDSVLVPAEIQDFYILPRATGTTVIEAYIPYIEEDDPYINKDVQPFLEGEES